jgi:hypothetical protein
LTFWTGHSGSGVVESEKLQGCTILIRKYWSLLSYNHGIISFSNW